jgi:hypothetical protein
MRDSELRRGWGAARIAHILIGYISRLVRAGAYSPNVGFGERFVDDAVLSEVCAEKPEDPVVDLVPGQAAVVRPRVRDQLDRPPKPL